jgi:hypothetical protein
MGRLPIDRDQLVLASKFRQLLSLVCSSAIVQCAAAKTTALLLVAQFTKSAFQNDRLRKFQHTKAQPIVRKAS